MTFSSWAILANSSLPKLLCSTCLTLIFCRTCGFCPSGTTLSAQHSPILKIPFSSSLILKTTLLFGGNFEGQLWKRPTPDQKPGIGGLQDRNTLVDSCRLNFRVPTEGKGQPFGKTTVELPAGKLEGFISSRFWGREGGVPVLAKSHCAVIGQQFSSQIVMSEGLKFGFLKADIKAQPLAIASLELMVLAVSILQSCWTTLRKAGILVPPPTSSILSSLIPFPSISSLLSCIAANTLEKIGSAIFSNSYRFIVYTRSLSSIRYSMFRLCSLLADNIFLCFSIFSNIFRVALRFSKKSQLVVFKKQARQNSNRRQSMSLQPRFLQWCCASMEILSLVKANSVRLSLECPKSTKSIFLAVPAKKSFLWFMQQSRAPAVASFKSRLTLMPAIYAASNSACLSYTLQQPGTDRTTGSSLLTLLISRMDLTLLRNAATTCSGRNEQGFPRQFTWKATRPEDVSVEAVMNFFYSCSNGLVGERPRNLVMQVMVSLKFVFSFTWPVYPKQRSVGPQPTMFGVSLKLASFESTQIPVFWVTAITDWKLPKSIPTAVGLGCC